MSTRVTEVVESFPEVSETFVANEADALRGLGLVVRVESFRRAARPNPDAPAGIPVAYRSDDSLGRRVRALAWLAARHPLGVARDVAGQRRWRREEGVRRLRTLAPAVRRAARDGSGHLHAHFAGGAALDAMRIGALIGRPYSVMTHGYDVFAAPANLREKHERAAFAATACEYSARYLREEFGVEARTLVMGVDPAAFQRTSPYPGGRTVVAIARLVEKKGLRHLVDAAARVRLDRLVIAGDGPLRAELESQARAAGLNGVAEFPGELAPSGVRSLLEQADLLAAPCVVAADGDRDTMPVVVKEALAMEVPVVASEEVGLPEVVRPEWGRLVPPGDSAALAVAIDELLALPAGERAAMGRAGRAHVAEHCDAAREAARLVGWIAEAEGR